MDKYILQEIGKWVKKHKEFIYEAKACNVQAQGADILKGKDCYYAVIKDVPMSADLNVQLEQAKQKVCLQGKIKNAKWLDNGRRITVKNNSFEVRPYAYGQSYSMRIAKFEYEE